MSKQLILLGATGLTGSSVLKYAIEDERVDKIICYLRKPSGLSSPKLKEVILSNDDFLELQQLEQADAVVCCLGTTIKKAGSKEAFKRVDVEIPIHFAGIAKKEGVTTFVVQSSLGAGRGASGFYLKCKTELEKSLSELNFNSLCIVRPSLLLGNRDEFRFGEKLGEFFLSLINPILKGRFKKYKAVKAKNVARIMLDKALAAEKGIHIYKSDVIQHYAK